MLLHHLVTMYLYGFSFMTNTLIGGVIAYLHDMADIWVTLLRIWGESVYQKFVLPTYIMTVLTWAYSRVIVLPYIIYLIYTIPKFAVSPYIAPIFIFLLSCLVVMHVYWLALIIRIALTKIRTGDYVDL